MNVNYDKVRVDLFTEDARRRPDPALLAFLAAASLRDLEGLRPLTLGLLEAWEELNTWERANVLFELAGEAGRITLGAARALASLARREDAI